MGNCIVKTDKWDNLYCCWTFAFFGFLLFWNHYSFSEESFSRLFWFCGSSWNMIVSFKIIEIWNKTEIDQQFPQFLENVNFVRMNEISLFHSFPIISALKWKVFFSYKAWKFYLFCFIISQLWRFSLHIYQNIDAVILSTKKNVPDSVFDL